MAVAHAYGANISNTLEAARTQVEKRFLDGGAVLLSVMEVLNRLLTSLDQLTGALDNNDGADAGAELRATVLSLSELPALEDRRQEDLSLLAGAASKLRIHVSDMQETMRYLRTFAVTAKITGAGMAEFAGFAEEILERIHSGTKEVNNFADQLDILQKDVKIALTFGANLSRSYAETVPAVAEALQGDARKIAEHRRALAAIAQEAGTIAKDVQNKVAMTLSALQIGDITRQRIEHVQSALAYLDEFLAADGNRALDARTRDRIRNVIHHLTAAQMNDMCGDFERESQNVVKTIASFSYDTQEILRLRDSMGRGHDDSGGNSIRALEESVSAAHTIVKQVEEARQQADRVSQSTLATAGRLLQAVENIRAVKTDINYMALNTNLRCSRMGEEGRSINVVTAELRIFAAKLDESADALVTGLAELEKAAGRIAPVQEANAKGLDERLSFAIDNIRSAANTTEEELAVLSEHGREVASKIGLSISKLDFQHDLGDVLARCADELNDLAGPDFADISDLADHLGPLDQKIFKLYTMVQERNVHRGILAAGEESVVAAEPTKSDDDEDLFADALF
ncbi:MULTISPECIES: chemotaxis protein [unclassified Sinorhizobium]|uniref:chemotaxis protein n=1 Tax=unclassified Sinorhizobium TaxID=2613772 RepID=UPI003526723E